MKAFVFQHLERTVLSRRSNINLHPYIGEECSAGPTGTGACTCALGLQPGTEHCSSSSPRPEDLVPFFSNGGDEISLHDESCSSQTGSDDERGATCGRGGIVGEGGATPGTLEAMMFRASRTAALLPVDRVTVREPREVHGAVSSLTYPTPLSHPLVLAVASPAVLADLGKAEAQVQPLLKAHPGFKPLHTSTDVEVYVGSMGPGVQWDPVN